MPGTILQQFFFYSQVTITYIAKFQNNDNLE